MHDMSAGLGTGEWSPTVGADTDWKKIYGVPKLKRTSAWKKKEEFSDNYFSLFHQYSH